LTSARALARALARARALVLRLAPQTTPDVKLKQPRRSRETRAAKTRTRLQVRARP